MGRIQGCTLKLTICGHTASKVIEKVISVSDKGKENTNSFPLNITFMRKLYWSLFLKLSLIFRSPILSGSKTWQLCSYSEAKGCWQNAFTIAFAPVDWKSWLEQMENIVCTEETEKRINSHAKQPQMKIYLSLLNILCFKTIMLRVNSVSLLTGNHLQGDPWRSC